MGKHITYWGAHVVALLLLAVIFVSTNLAANVFLRHARLDLTEYRLFTLSAGTHRILENLDTPITLQFYYSQKLATDYPSLRLYGQRVRDMLEEMVNLSAGNLQLEIIDPAPFSEDEDAVLAQGLVAQPVANNDVVYFGLVGTNLAERVETIPFFADERQEYLEYDLARLIHNLVRHEKPTLGIISNLPLDTGAGGIAAALQGQSQPFLIYNELIDRFQVAFIAPDAMRIPKHIDVLLLAHPRPLAIEQAYAVDQFVMRGGRVIAFLDPQSEVSLTAGPDNQPLRGATEQSNLPLLMRQWGVVMDDTQIIADRKRAQKVATGTDARRLVTDYILWLALEGEDMARDDVVTASIDRLHLGTVGRLVPHPQAATAFQPLIWASDDAGLLPRDYVLQAPTPDALLQRFAPIAERLVIAARINGRVATAFPDGPPNSAPDTESDENKISDTHILTQAAAHILVFADSDFFDDRFWVSEQIYQGQRFGVPIADNAKFLLNAVEHMMGSEDLISLRGRERAARLFTRVEAMRRAAATRYQAEETRLLLRIDEAQRELDRLEREGSALSDTQNAAQTYRRELLAARKALRRVQADLNREIDALGAWLMWINSLAVPLVLVVCALIVGQLRRRRRRATQRAAGFM